MDPKIEAKVHAAMEAAIAEATLIDQPWKIMSIARRDWAAVGHSI